MFHPMILTCKWMKQDYFETYPHKHLTIKFLCMPVIHWNETFEKNMAFLRHPTHNTQHLYEAIYNMEKQNNKDIYYLLTQNIKNNHRNNSEPHKCHIALKQ